MQEKIAFMLPGTAVFQYSVTALKQVKNPFSKAFLLSDLQRRGRRCKKQHISSPQPHQESFTQN